MRDNYSRHIRGRDPTHEQIDNKDPRGDEEGAAGGVERMAAGGGQVRRDLSWRRR